MEKRRQLRVPFEAEVLLFDAAENRVIASSSTDFCIDGLFVATPEPLATGTRYDIKIVLSDQKGRYPIRTKGAVVRTTEDGAALMFAKPLGLDTLKTIYDQYGVDHPARSL